MIKEVEQGVVNLLLKTNEQLFIQWFTYIQTNQMLFCVTYLCHQNLIYSKRPRGTLQAIPPHPWGTPPLQQMGLLLLGSITNVVG